MNKEYNFILISYYMKLKSKSKLSNVKEKLFFFTSEVFNIVSNE